MLERIEEERERIRKERKTMVKDAIALAVVVVILTAFLLVWKVQITGMQVIENEEHFCSDYSGFGFVSDEDAVLSRADSYQLKLSCLPGEIVFHDNSDFIDVSPTGLVKLRDIGEIPSTIDAIIIAEHESGEFVHKKIRFRVK